MGTNHSVRQWQAKFSEGAFKARDCATQCAAGWYDWFCKDDSLAAKTQKIGAIISEIKPGGKIDLDAMYPWFKNNCFVTAKGTRLVNDFRFADLATGSVAFTILLDHGYRVYCPGHWTDPVAEFTRPESLVRWLNTPWPRPASESTPPA